MSVVDFRNIIESFIEYNFIGYINKFIQIIYAASI